LESGTFWLSETPGNVFVGWDAALPRICTYGLFEDLKSAKNFWVFNIHFDHRGVSARTQSATLLIDQINAINSQQYPLILMGDFNATVEEKPIQIIKSQLLDSKDIAKVPVKGPAGTVNGFKSVENRIIDFIFCSGFSVLSVEHVEARTSQDRHLSDHLPVIAEIIPDN
jgi:endonuclease/exonuclease/phosphatase family metal-dependent hydrolase